MLVVAGFSSGCIVIGYAFAKESAPNHLSGTISGLYNNGGIAGADDFATRRRLDAGFVLAGTNAKQYVTTQPDCF